MLTRVPNLKTRASIACAIALTAGALPGHAQQPGLAPVPGNSAPRADSRVINVTVVDDKGQPVTDLTSADFQIFDEGKSQPIRTFRALSTPATGKTPPPTALILFDLLNTFAGQRENSTTLIAHALQPLEGGGSVFLYLLTNHGDLYPVHALAMPPPTAVEAHGAGDQKPSDPPWTRQVRPLLDQAIEKVNALRLKDYQDEGVGAAATFLALNELGDAFMKVPGPKTIVWITRGAPNWLDYRFGCKDVLFPEGSGVYLGGRCGNDCTRRAGVGKCVDYTPFLQHFGEKLTRSDTIFYSVMVDPEGAIFNTDRGRPRDTLQQLADLSGGRLYFHGEIDEAITRSLQDVRARYQLSYDAPLPNGKYHKLHVECSRKGVRTEAPQGYYAETAQKK